MRNLEIKLKMKVNIDIHSKQCRFCKKVFSQKCNCSRHTIICKKKLEYLTYLEKKLKEIDEQTIKAASITNNNNCTTNNNIINIHVNSIGNEDISYITTKALKQLWNTVKSDEEGVAKTIKMIHGNKDHPENHNIIYTNMRSNTCLVKEGEIFEYRNIKEVLKDVSANTLDMIVLNTDYDDLHKLLKEKYEKVCDDDELNGKASTLAKTELYNGYKIGEIRRLDSQNSLESKLELSESSSANPY